MFFRRSRRTVVEALEHRQLLHAVILSPVADVNVSAGSSPTVIDLSGRYDNTDTSGTVVRLSTTQGDIYVDLFDSLKPTSVANFLSYLQSGRYDGTVFHSAGRLDGNNAAGREFLSGGAYKLPDLNPIADDGDAPIADELGISNTRGTIAFATPGGPNSAKSEFFINLSSDSSYVASRDATSSVFGQIINGSISVADAISSNPIFDFNEPSFPTNFDSLPLKDYTGFPDVLPGDESFLTLNGGTVIPEMSFAVSSDSPGVVTASISGNSLTLNYAGGAGVANITVSITTVDGGVTEDTFTVGVGQAEDSFTIVNIGEGADARSVTYTDADGTVGRVSLSRGSAAVRFTGTGVAQTLNGSTVTVTGTNLVISTIDVTGTDGRGTLTMTGSNAGDGQIQVGSITSAQGLSSISGRDVNLSGSSSINGGVSTVRLNSLAGLTVAGSVSSLTAESASGDITIGGDARSVTIDSVIGMSDLSVTGKVSTLRVSSMEGDVQVGGALSNGRLGIVNGNMEFGSVRTLRADSVTGNFSVTENASSVRFDSINGNTTIGGKATTLRLGDVLGNSNITVNGAASTINLASMANGAVSVGVNGGSSLSFTIGVATDVSLTSAIRLRTLKADAWTNTGGVLETITAPRISTLSVAGDFAPNLVLTGQPGSTTLSSARINGQIASGTWTITGNVSSLTAGAIAAAWNNAISGRLSNFRVNGDLASNLDAGSIGTATIRGNLTGNVTTRDAFNARTKTLSRLSVSGAMIDAFVQSSGNIGTISAGSMSGTHIFAGAAPEAEEFPNSPADFSVAAKISTVTVKRGDATTFSNSTIAAMSLGSINLGTITSFSNGGSPFGLVGDVISSVTARTGTGTFSDRRLDDPTESVTTEDFQVRVL